MKNLHFYLFIFSISCFSYMLRSSKEKNPCYYCCSRWQNLSVKLHRWSKTNTVALQLGKCSSRAAEEIFTGILGCISRSAANRLREVMILPLSWHWWDIWGPGSRSGHPGARETQTYQSEASEGPGGWLRGCATQAEAQSVREKRRLGGCYQCAQIPDGK